MMGDISTKSLFFVGLILLSLTTISVVSDAQGYSISPYTVEIEGSHIDLGDTADSRLSLNFAPDSGISSYNISVSVDNKSVVDITGATMPDRFDIADSTVTSNQNKIILNAVDSGSGEFKGEDNITLSTINLKGKNRGHSGLDIKINSIENGTGGEIIPMRISGLVVVSDPSNNNRLEFEADGGSTLPGSDVGVNFSLTNIGDTVIDKAHIQIDTANRPIPDGWSYSAGLNSGGTPWWNANLYWESPSIGSSETINPSLIFSIPDSEDTGTYNLAFEAHIPTDSGVESVVKDNATITVNGENNTGNEPPIAEDFGVIPQNPNVGQQITFDASGSIDPDGTIQTYQWKLSDTSRKRGKTITHTYDSSGTYTVELKVVDDDGASSTVTKTVQVGSENKGEHNLNIETDIASQGNNVTIDVYAESVTGISLESIPNGWTVNSSSDDGGFLVTDDPDNDGHNESVGWGFLHQEIYNPSVTLDIPENTKPKQYELVAVAQNGGEQTKTFNISLKVFGDSIIDQYDQNNNGQISGQEVRTAIQDFLFKDMLTGNQIRKIIQHFLFK